MFKLSALNDTHENVSGGEKPLKDTKEALEAQAFNLYNEALRLQQNDHRNEAVKMYERLLETPLVIESATTLVNEHNEAIEHPLKDPGLILKYSAHKNVASICASQGHVNKAMENYLQAVMLDTSDVTLWYRIGILAAQLSNLHLSRRALTQGLECNPNHWPCLDSVITVCYAILDYENCLSWISKALKKDSYYKKGIYLRRKMISECPHLKKHFDHLFQNCGTEVFQMEICEEDMKDILREPLTLRENFRKLCAPPEIPVTPLKIPLKTLSWLNLGRSLIATYEFIESQDEPISITSPINMKVFETDTGHTKHKDLPKENPMDIDVNADSSKAEKEAVDEEPKAKSLSIADESATVCLNSTESAMEDSSFGLLSTPVSCSDSNTQKKSIKRKKPVEKMVDIAISRRSERRSSRMKPRLQAKSTDDICFSPEPDFRHSLLQMLPKTLQLQRQSSVPVDLDSDTNSQGSSIVYPDAEMGQSSCSKDDRKSPIAKSFDQEMELAVSITDQVDDNVKSQTASNITISGDPEVSGKAFDIKEEPLEVMKPESEADFLSKKIKLEAIDEAQNTHSSTNNTNVLSNQQKATSDNSNHNSMAQENIISIPVEDGTKIKTTSESNGAPETIDKSHTILSSPVKTAPEESEEEKQVKQFIKMYNDEHGGILHLLQLYCKWMGRRSHLKWEKGLTDVFLKAFSITQPSLRLEPFMINNLVNKNRVMFAFYLLTHLECALDKNYKKYSLSFKYVPSSLEYTDMDYIIQASCHPEVFEEDSMPEYRFKHFILRYHWVRANYFFLRGDKNSVLAELTVCSKLCIADTEISLHHLDNHNKINLSLINKRINSLKRFQLLEEIESLLAKEQFSDALKILTSNVKFDDEAKMDKHRLLTENISAAYERPKLLTYMIKAALGIDDVRATLENISKVLWEAVDWVPYLNKKKLSKDSNSSKLHEKWQSLSNLCCFSLSSIIDKDLQNLALLEKEDLMKVTDCLVSLNHHNLSHLPSKSQLTVKTSHMRDIFRPWILLHKVTKFGESQLESAMSEEIPPSTRLLVTAHEWLGEKGCCCLDGGTVLRLLLKSLMDTLNRVDESSVKQSSLSTSSVALEKPKSSPLEQKINVKTCIEQCFYCLFSYPNKISKSSALSDHGAQQTALKWQDAFQLYKYYRPRALPAFDSYKINTMLSEMAGLLTRIVKLMPENVSTKLTKSLYKLEDFLKNGDATKDLEVEPVCDNRDMAIIKDIYYLLADYYFKNNDMTQAGKHYMYDLCVNPRRFDSWAGLALVKSSILDQYFRLCSTKLVNQVTSKEESVVEFSKITLLCFQKAMNIEGSSTTLWIEYGTLAYWMHSYLSRQIRMKKRLRAEEIAFKKTLKTSMLDQAEKCFESALSCDSDDISSEEWLILYMLGKVHEKKQAPINKYLPNYSRAASLLHRKHAKYPKKIQFKSYQTDYAIEALEMYFRLHSSILKLAQHELNCLEGFDDGETRPLLTEEDFELIIDLMDEAEGSNFARRESLPSNQLYEKSTDLTSKKAVSTPKLAIPGAESHSRLSMGSLVPDSVVSALSIQLSVDSVSNDEQLMETDEIASNKDTENDIRSPEICSKTNGADKISSPVQEKVSSQNPVKEVKEKPPLDDTRRRDLCTKLVKSSVSAIHLCLGRLPQHYKAVYRLASLYQHCNPALQQLTWSRDLLLGSDTAWQQLNHMPCQGLLSERNKTNLFNGVWKIPVDEIDRPGSFGFHLYRCILLLLDVLLSLRDHNKLFYLHNMLNRTPDQGRKYLQDSDRVLLCKKALSYSIKALHKKVGALSAITATVVSEEQPIARERFRYLMDAAKICQQKQRMGNPNAELLPKKHGSSERHKELLIMAYEKYIAISLPITTPLPNIDLYPAVVKVERILKFCQQHSSAQVAKTSHPTSVISAQLVDSKANEIGNETTNQVIGSSSARDDYPTIMTVSDTGTAACNDDLKTSDEISKMQSSSKELPSQECSGSVSSILKPSSIPTWNSKHSSEGKATDTTTSNSMSSTKEDSSQCAPITSTKESHRITLPQQIVTSNVSGTLGGHSSGFSVSDIISSSPPVLTEMLNKPFSNVVRHTQQPTEQQQNLSMSVAGDKEDASVDFRTENLKTTIKNEVDSRYHGKTVITHTSNERNNLVSNLESDVLPDFILKQKETVSPVQQMDKIKMDIGDNMPSSIIKVTVTDSLENPDLEAKVGTSRQFESSPTPPSIKAPTSYSSEGRLSSSIPSSTGHSDYFENLGNASTYERKPAEDVTFPTCSKIPKLESPALVVSPPPVASKSATSSSISSQAELTTVIQGEKTYTKITPSKPVSCLSPSPRSAFTSRKSPMKNLRIEKLRTQNKEPLSRSASLPESSNVTGHKTLHRTGSISEYTKQKLKSSILMKTSASLVKKPSITEMEIEQVLGDVESSQSEEEDDMETTFRPLAIAKIEPNLKSSRPINVPIAIAPVSMSLNIENESDDSSS